MPAQKPTEAEEQENEPSLDGPASDEETVGSAKMQELQLEAPAYSALQDSSTQPATAVKQEQPDTITGMSEKLASLQSEQSDAEANASATDARIAAESLQAGSETDFAAPLDSTGEAGCSKGEKAADPEEGRSHQGLPNGKLQPEERERLAEKRSIDEEHQIGSSFQDPALARLPSTSQG